MSIFRNDGRKKFRVILIIESILIIGLLCAIFFTIQDKKSNKTVPKLYSTCNYSTPLTAESLSVISATIKKGLTYIQATNWFNVSTSIEDHQYSCVSIYSSTNNNGIIKNDNTVILIQLPTNLTSSEQVHVTDLVYSIMTKTGDYSKITILKHPQMYG